MTQVTHLNRLMVNRLDWRELAQNMRLILMLSFQTECFDLFYHAGRIKSVTTWRGGGTDSFLLCLLQSLPGCRPHQNAEESYHHADSS